MPLDTNVRAHTDELRGKHKAVLKDVLGDDGVTVGERGKHHDLSLHVGGEPGERQGLNVNRGKSLAALDAHALLYALDAHTHALEFLEDHPQVMRIEAENLDSRRDRRRARRRR